MSIRLPSPITAELVSRILNAASRLVPDGSSCSIGRFRDGLTTLLPQLTAQAECSDFMVDVVIRACIHVLGDEVNLNGALLTLGSDPTRLVQVLHKATALYCEPPSFPDFPC